VVKIEEENREKENREIKPTELKRNDCVTINKNNFWKFTTVVLIAILAVMAFRGNSGAGTTGAVVGVPSVGGTAPPAPSAGVTDMKVLSDDDPFMGKKDAPVTIVEFSDYECPFCERFYQQTLPQIKSQYIDTGKVKFVYRDFPLGFHQQAEPAAIAANCAGVQDKYFEYHDKIFNSGGAAGKSSADYKKWAQELGLNLAKWEACLSDPAQKQEIQKDLADGSAAGVQGTPGFIINGKVISGAQPFSVFQQVIDAELN